MSNIDVIPDTIKAFRTKHRLSQTTLALMLGLSQGTISGWESGHKRPRGPALILLRQLLAEAGTPS